MPKVTISASREGAHKTPLMIVGNPEAQAVLTSISATTWPGSPSLALTPGALNRVLVVQSDVEIDICMTKAGQDPTAVPSLRLQVPAGGVAAYAAFTEAGTAAVYVRTP